MKVKITSEASELINKKRNSNDKADELVIAIYRHTMRSWSRTFCQDIVQLVRKELVVQHGGFEKWNNNGEDKKLDVEVYIDKILLSEVALHDINLVVDKKLWSRWGLTQDSLRLKIES